MASAGTVTVDFAAETAKFTAELKKVNDRLKGMESSFKLIENAAKGVFAGVSVAALVSFTKSAITAADAIGDMADRIGTTANELSKLQFAAKQSDVEIEALNSSLQKMQKNLSDAFRGEGTAVSALAQLNLNAEQFRSIGMEDQLRLIADEFQRVQNPADRVRIAVDLFSKAGAQLVPLLARGSAGIKELTAEAERLGIALDDRAVKSIDRSTKALEKLESQIKSFIANRAGGLVADIFGSGDEVLDKEAQLRNAIQLRGQLLAAFDREHSEGLKLQIDAYNTKIDLLNTELDKLKQIQTAQQAAVNPRFPSNHARLGPDLLGGEVTARSDRRRIPGSPENFDDLAAEFRDKQLEDQKKFDEVMLQDTSEFLNKSAEAQIKSAEDLSKELTRLDSERVNASQFWREFEINQEREKAEKILKIQQEGVQAAQALYTAFGGKYKKFAQALLVVEKAKAVAQIVVDTQVAASKALSTYGPTPVGFGAAALAVGFGAARLAAVAATFIGGNSAPQLGGSGSSPVFTSGVDTSIGNDTRATADAKRTVQVILNGPVYGVDDFNKRVIDAIEIADESDVQIIKPNGATGQSIRAAA